MGLLQPPVKPVPGLRLEVGTLKSTGAKASVIQTFIHKGGRCTLVTPRWHVTQHWPLAGFAVIPAMQLSALESSKFAAPENLCRVIHGELRAAVVNQSA